MCLGAAAALLRGRSEARVLGVPGVAGAPGPHHGPGRRGLQELPGEPAVDGAGLPVYALGTFTACTGSINPPSPPPLTGSKKLRDSQIPAGA